MPCTKAPSLLIGRTPMSTSRCIVYTVEVGQRFGRGVVIEAEIRIPTTDKTHPFGVRGVRLLCDCGTTYEARTRNLFAINPKLLSLSCGCLLREGVANSMMRQYTKEEISYIQELLAEGFDTGEIAHELCGNERYVCAIKSGKYSV